MKATVAAAPPGGALTEPEFEDFRRWIRSAAGINLSEMKRSLVMARLHSRLKHYGLESYGQYFSLLMDPAQAPERQHAIDLLTTNETHFFREARHFDFLAEWALAAPRARSYRVWSAACSTGEEPYSIAMTLAERLGQAAWDVFASDLSVRVLEQAQRGQYRIQRAQSIPRPLLERYCLRGVGAQDGTFLVDRALRARVQFAQVNLNAALPEIGRFDVVFLRNAMIYFDLETRRAVTARVLAKLHPGGYIVVGHAESLNDLSDAVDMVAPSVYRKRDGHG